MPSQLLIILIERIGLLIALSFLATRSRTFRRMMTGGTTRWERVRLGLVFGFFGILGTYTGVIVSPEGISWTEGVTGPLPPHEAIANSRAVAVVVAGLMGGPWTGLTAGLLAGGHRMMIGGFTGLACGIATSSQGLLSGLLQRYLARTRSGPSPGVALLVGVLMELLQMGIILLVARPFEASVALVELIAGPMTLANSAGISLFLALTRSILTAEAALEGDAARNALTIATQTLPLVSRGLNRETAEAAAKVIRSVTGLTAVAITDTSEILAHVGLGADHHRAGSPMLTRVTRRALQEDRILVADEPHGIECTHPHCPLQGVVVVPLHEGERVVGSLKLYFDPAQVRPPLELAEGLAYHFSTQLALARAQEQSALLDKAEIRALQAQIQPHFLFNALNTVMALIRVDPPRAREVLGHLADFLRRNLQSTQVEVVPLSRELEHVQHYLSVEQARFGDRLEVRYRVAPEALEAELPPLTLQPLVENAVIHGLKPVKRPWELELAAAVSGSTVEVCLRDNGQGIEPDRLAHLLERPAGARGEQSGLALYNVHQRLRGLFGGTAGLSIASTPGAGTTVTVRFPIRSKREEGDGDTGTGGR
ncbi:MAG: LytS/YhcK type 5TM receptor domain-containing protein [Bacillota bacterium]